MWAAFGLAALAMWCGQGPEFQRIYFWKAPKNGAASIFEKMARFSIDSDTLREEAYAAGRAPSNAQIQAAVATGSLARARESLGLPAKVTPSEVPQLEDYAQVSPTDPKMVLEICKALTEMDTSLVTLYSRWEADRSSEGGGPSAAEPQAASPDASQDPTAETPVTELDSLAARFLSELRLMEWTLHDLEDALKVAERERAEDAADVAKAADEAVAAAEAAAADEADAGRNTSAAVALERVGRGGDGGARDEKDAKRVAEYEGSVRKYIADKLAWVEVVRSLVAAPLLPGGAARSTSFDARLVAVPENQVTPVYIYVNM